MSFGKKVSVKLTRVEFVGSDSFQKYIDTGHSPLIRAFYTWSDALRVSIVSTYAPSKDGFKHSQSDALPFFVTMFFIMLFHLPLESFFNSRTDLRSFTLSVATMRRFIFVLILFLFLVVVEVTHCIH